MKKLINLIALGSIMCGISSCENYSPMEYNAIPIVKAPELKSYVNNTLLDTKSVDVNGNLWYQQWDRPTNVTEEERAKVIEEFSKVRLNAVNNIIIDFENYWVQQVYTGEQTYTDGYGGNIGTGSSHMNHLLAYNNGYYEHINNFNNGSNNTVYTDDVTKEQFIGTTLMTNMSCDILEQFGYHNSTDSKNHFEYIVLEIDGYYYVGFDFYANGTQEYPANKNMDVDRDWVFNDWIIKITPAYHVGETPSLPDTPSTEPNDSIYDEVEVNLAVNDPLDNGDYISSHLSIHVRANTDVEVFIPVPAQYYCESDDTDIVLKHDIEYIYGETFTTSYNIEGNEVTLNVIYLEDGIKIWTDGINEDVINYCRDKYGDGITFEVWNYFNDNISRGVLMDYLNMATIKFLDKNPMYYINAFTDEGNDCSVNLDSSVESEYDTPYEGTHYNNYDHNKFYKRL